MYAITIIKADGTTEKSESMNPPGLPMLQEAVGGYIETVPYFDRFEGSDAVAFCNAQGKLKGLGVNAAATNAWYDAMGQVANDVLVGDIIVITGTRAALSKV